MDFFLTHNLLQRLQSEYGELARGGAINFWKVDLGKSSHGKSAHGLFKRRAYWLRNNSKRRLIFTRGTKSLQRFKSFF